jgi:hypothetical protein
LNRVVVEPLVNMSVSWGPFCERNNPRIPNPSFQNLVSSNQSMEEWKKERKGANYDDDDIVH